MTKNKIKRYAQILFVVGLFTIVAGFFFDVNYAGIPYQDPTAEMTEQYNNNRHIAEIIMKTGVAVSAITLGLLLFGFKKGKPFQSS